MGFEQLYEIMMGYVPSQDNIVKDEFSGRCEALYGDTLEARIRLSRLLDGDSDGENADCMRIVYGYEAIMKLMCQRAYEYGLREGRGVL